jgi:HAD superfamily hydrolase (TIGR01509 family)
LTGVPYDAFAAVAEGFSADVMTGKLTIGQAIVKILPELGVEPRKSLADELNAADRHFLAENARVFDDAIELLHHLREREARVAFVSNCADNTRGLIAGLGLDAYANTSVLSCEVGAAKPEPKIYQVALDRLGVHPDDTVLVDDQLLYCEGAMALGIHAMHLVRSPSDASPAARLGGPTVIPSCRVLMD